MSVFLLASGLIAGWLTRPGEQYGEDSASNVTET
jgi:hypothetical protein